MLDLQANVFYYLTYKTIGKLVFCGNQKVKDIWNCEKFIDL